MAIIQTTLHPKLVKVCRVGVHKAHEVGHATYLALVFKEAHGLYGYAAGALLVVVVLGWLFGEDPDEGEETKRRKYAVAVAE